MAKRKCEVAGPVAAIAPTSSIKTEQRASQRPIRLLLHAVDGVVPYMTPESLRKFFPMSSYNDRLLLGMAVRDTCVVPVYPQDKTRPRGYTFSSSVAVDAWLYGYKRVTVPSFDLINDEADKKDSNFTVNDNHVMTWTSNGRLALTPQLHAEACQGLDSSVTLPLYDMIPPIIADAASTSSKGNARSRSAITRTRNWFEHFVATNAGKDREIWAPLLVDPTKGVDFEHQIDFIRWAMKEHRVQGVVLVGWKHLRDTDLARQVLVTARETLQLTNMDLIVLATDSLKQFLLAATNGCTVVGSDFAARMAELHNALVVDVSGWKLTNDSSKRSRTDDQQIFCLDDNGCIDLQSPARGVKTHTWFSDTSPMVSGCSCFACKTHSRSYIYHLVCAKELLADMLLMVHNLHHTLQLFKCLEEARVLDQADEFYEYICQQLGGP